MSLVWRNAAGVASPTGDVNEELTAKFTFLDDDVRAVYIDWDDGTSNLKTQANYQWVEIDEPKRIINVNHTYTASGAFNPVVQFINSDGFVSRYYSNEADDATGNDDEVIPFTQRTAISGVTISDTKATVLCE